MTSLVYNDGTASVTNGSPVVTGHGTAWALGLVAGGSFSLAGMSVPIASVDSDTSLTLAYDWPGTTEAEQHYAIALETAQAVRAAWINVRLAQFHQKPWGIGVLPDGRGTLAERDALDPMPVDNFCWLRVEVDEPAELYFKVPSGWLGPYPFIGEEGPPGPALVPAGEWADDVTYQRGRYVSHNGRTFASRIDGNLNNEPPDADEDSAEWMFVPAIQGAQGEPGPQGDPGEKGEKGDKGDPGSITGVTDFWNERLAEDEDAAEARLGLGVGSVGEIDLPSVPEGKLLDDSGNWIDPPESGGYDPNMALLALEMADLKGSRMGMVGGVADPFDDESGVDAGASSNYEHDDGNHWFVPTYPPVTPALAVTLGANTALIPQRTYRNRINTSLLSGAGLYVRVRIESGTVSPKQFSNAFIGRAAASGNAWDMAASGPAPVRLTFGGNNSAAITGGVPIWSDWVPFTFDGAFSHIVAIDMPGNGSENLRTLSGQGGNASAYYKDGADEAHLPAPTGYQIAAGYIVNVSGIEVANSITANNMTLTSIAYPAATEPALGRLAIQIVEDDPITINDDVTAEISRDGGTTWSQATLVLVSSLDSVKLYEDANIDLSGQPAGDDVVWRVKTDNNVDVAVSGIVAQWR